MSDNVMDGNVSNLFGTMHVVREIKQMSEGDGVPGFIDSSEIEFV